jgi:hypothetical protein
VLKDVKVEGKKIRAKLKRMEKRQLGHPCNFSKLLGSLNEVEGQP